MWPKWNVATTISAIPIWTKHISFEHLELEEMLLLEPIFFVFMFRRWYTTLLLAIFHFDHRQPHHRIQFQLCSLQISSGKTYVWWIWLGEHDEWWTIFRFAWICVRLIFFTLDYIVQSEKNKWHDWTVFLSTDLVSVTYIKRWLIYLLNTYIY